jgi:hypothetical protein
MAPKNSREQGCDTMQPTTYSTVFVALAMCSFGCTHRIGQGDYDRIKLDMTRQEIESILGEPSIVAPGDIAAMPLPEIEEGARIIDWQCDDPVVASEDGEILAWQSGRRMIMIDIVRDKVVSKSKGGF